MTRAGTETGKRKGSGQNPYVIYITIYLQYMVDNSGFQAERPDFCNPTVDSSSVTTAGKEAIGNCGE
jgi:hypothetical protein